MLIGVDTLDTSTADIRDADTLGGLYNATDISNIQQSLTVIQNPTYKFNTEEAIGKLEDGTVVYRKRYNGNATSSSASFVIDSTLTYSYVTRVLAMNCTIKVNSSLYFNVAYASSDTSQPIDLRVTSNGLTLLQSGGFTTNWYSAEVIYTKA